jgi:hypothetical protein
VAVLAPIAVWYWMQYCGAKMMDTDYAAMPASQMFERVVGFQVPHGIEIQKVAGHHGPGTGMVWMKFSGNDKSLDDMTKNMVSVETGFHYSIPDGFGVQKIFNQDARAAGWDEVADLSKPQVFLFRTAGNGERWNGTVVLARQSHTGYLSASLVKPGA